MDIRADIQGVRSIAQIDAALPVARIADVREEASARLAQIAIGQQVQATVESLLADGSFLVKLSDTAIRTNLPTGSKVGDALQLTLVATEPRPTFSLEGEAGATGAAPTTLSPAARLIDTLLQRGGTETALIGKTPLVGSPAAAPEQIAGALQKTVDNSGLFYESHLQQWAAGTRPFADLLREPQNLHLPAAPAAASGSTPEVLALVSRYAPDGTHLSVVTSDPTTTRVESTLTPATAHIVNLQLNTLEQPRIQWQGEVWPGQQMQWEVSQATDNAQPHEADDTQRSWQSVVRFDLPSLGKVAATITLSGDRVTVQMRAADPASANTLRSNGKSLADALGAAGSRLDSLTVRQDEQA